MHGVECVPAGGRSAYVAAASSSVAAPLCDPCGGDLCRYISLPPCHYIHTHLKLRISELTLTSNIAGCVFTGRHRELQFPSTDEQDMEALARREAKAQGTINRIQRLLMEKKAELRGIATARGRLTARAGASHSAAGGGAEAAAEERMLLFDRRGREVYGDAWDDGEDGGLPLREVFLMSEEEVKELKGEAAKMFQTIVARTPRDAPRQAGRGGAEAGTSGVGALPPVPAVSVSARGAAGGVAVPKLDFSRVRFEDSLNSVDPTDAPSAAPAVPVAADSGWASQRAMAASASYTGSAAPTGGARAKPASGGPLPALRLPDGSGGGTGGVSRIEQALARGAEYRARQQSGQGASSSFAVDVAPPAPVSVGSTGTAGAGRSGGSTRAAPGTTGSQSRRKRDSLYFYQD